MSDMFDTEMSKLRGDVAAQTSVIESATSAFRGLTMRLVAAEAAAKNAGATDVQVAAVTTLRQELEANTASLASAIPANTAPIPADPQPTSPAVPTDVPASSSVAAEAPSATPADAAALAANQAR